MTKSHIKAIIATNWLETGPPSIGLEAALSGGPEDIPTASDVSQFLGGGRYQHDFSVLLVYDI